MLEFIELIFTNIYSCILTLAMTIIAIPVVIIVGVMTAISVLFQTKVYSIAGVQDEWARIRYARVAQ